MMRIVGRGDRGRKGHFSGAVSTSETATTRIVAFVCHPERNALESRDLGGEVDAHVVGIRPRGSLDSTAFRSG